MNELVNTQTLLFVKCIEIGILMGMLYDLIRIFRKIIKHYNWVVQVEDALYWLGCSFIGFGILYIHNYAEIRLFGIIGMILGGILYLCTFSILFMKVATWIIDWIRRVLKYVIHLISIPIRWIVSTLAIPIRYVYKILGLANAKQKRNIKSLRRKWYQQKSDIKTTIKSKKRK